MSFPMRRFPARSARARAPSMRGLPMNGGAMTGIAVRALPLLAAFALLGGCAVGPDFKAPPPPQTSGRFARAGQAQPVAAPGRDSSNAADEAFWKGFGDPQLSRLIGQALAANLDIHQSVARLDAANVLLRNAKFDQYPTVTASAQIGHQLLSRDQAFGAPRSERNTPVSGGDINVSWELDLFGRVRRGVEAQRADVEASAADLLAVRVAIEGAVAQAYVDLRGNQERLRIARDNVDNQRDTLSLIRVRVTAGRASDLDEARERTQFETTTSRIAAYEALIGVDEHRLAVLTGQAPEALIVELEGGGSRPALPAAIDPGTPADLLRRRPDVAAAEARLHEATARVGVATADLFPRLTLTGLIGSLTDSYGFIRSGSEQNSVALGIDWSFLDIGRVRARLEASRADAAGELAQYQQTVLEALEETENALLRSSRSQEETQHLEQAAAASVQAAQLAQARFKAGAIGYYEVLDAERSRLQAQDAAAEAAVRRDDATVAVYMALAGGWPQGDVK